MDFSILKNEKVVVKCESKEEASNFFKECIENKITNWVDSSRISLQDNIYDYFPEKNCYRVYMKVRLEYGTETYFKNKGCKVINYTK